MSSQLIRNWWLSAEEKTAKVDRTKSKQGINVFFIMSEKSDRLVTVNSFRIMPVAPSGFYTLERLPTLLLPAVLGGALEALGTLSEFDYLQKPCVEITTTMQDLHHLIQLEHVSTYLAQAIPMAREFWSCGESWRIGCAAATGLFLPAKGITGEILPVKIPYGNPLMHQF